MRRQRQQRISQESWRNSRTALFNDTLHVHARKREATVEKIYIDRLHYQTTGLRCRRSVRKLALWQHTKEEKNIVTLIFCVFMEIKFFSTLLTLPTLDTYFISFTARAAADRTDAMCVFLDIRVNKLKLFSIWYFICVSIRFLADSFSTYIYFCTHNKNINDERLERLQIVHLPCLAWCCQNRLSVGFWVFNSTCTTKWVVF